MMGWGEGIIQPGEDCEGADLAGATCAVLGYYGETGGLRCLDTCRFDENGCEGFCGDGIISGGELCDGANLAGATCTSLDYYDEAGLACGPSCNFDSRACTGFCGDGQVNGPELCDTDSPPGKACMDFGFDMGPVSCAANCGAAIDACEQIGWELDFLPGGSGIWDLWVDGDRKIAVGPPGKAFHFDGSRWTTLSVPASPGASPGWLYRVWGAGPSDVFAVGSERVSSVSEGTIVHYCGSQWSVMTRLLIMSAQSNTNCSPLRH